MKIPVTMEDIKSAMERPKTDTILAPFELEQWDPNGDIRTKLATLSVEDHERLRLLLDECERVGGEIERLTNEAEASDNRMTRAANALEIIRLCGPLLVAKQNFTLEMERIYKRRF